MRKLLLILLLIFTAVNAAAQYDNLVVPRPDASRFTVQKNIEYRSGQRLDLYRPPGDDVLPVVIFINGVGSPTLKELGAYVHWGQIVADAGLAAIHYQSAPGTAIEDFDAVMTFLHANDQYRVDTSRVVVWASSANVQPGLPIAMDPKRTYLKGAVLYYGTGPDTNIRLDLPVYYIRAGADVGFINDGLEKTVAKALAANAPWTIENYGGGLHGFDARNDSEVARILIRRTIEFAKLAVAPGTATSYADAATIAGLYTAFAKGDWKAVADGYSARVVQYPNEADTHRRLGIALSELGKPREAVASLQKAWDLGMRGARDVSIHAAVAAARADDEPSALLWLERAMTNVDGKTIRENPAFSKLLGRESFETLVSDGDKRRDIMALFNQRKGEEAVKTLLATDKRSRLHSAAALNDFAYAALTRGLTREAVTIGKRAVELYPQDANAHETLSELYEAAGDKKLAMTTARRSLDVLAKDKTLSEEGRKTIADAANARVKRLGSGDVAKAEK